MSTKKEWILLKVLGKDRFAQEGPYSTSQLKEYIKTQQVEVSDYVWQEGYDSWVPIGEIDVFLPLFHREFNEEDQSFYSLKPVEALSSEELLEEVYVLSKEGPEKMLPEKEDVPVAPAPPVKISWPEWNINPKHLKVGLFASFLFMTAFVIMYSSFKDVAKDEKAQSQVSAKQKSYAKKLRIKKEKVAKTEALRRQKEAESQPREATYLEIRFSKLKGKNPSLILATDGRRQNLELSIYGKAGEILGRKSYYHKLRFKITGKLELNLKKIGLDKGFYRLVANIGAVRKSQKFRIGYKNAEFKRDLYRQKKRLSYWHQREKVQLVASASRLVLQAKDLSVLLGLKSQGQRSWGKVISRWKKKVNRIYLRKLSQELVYPEEWANLAAHQAQLLSLAKDARSQAALRAATSRLIQFENQFRSLSLW